MGSLKVSEEGLHMHRNTPDEGRRWGTDVSGFPALGGRAGLQPGPHREGEAPCMTGVGRRTRHLGERPGHHVSWVGTPPVHLNLTLFGNRVFEAEVRADEGGPKANSWHSDKERELWKWRHAEAEPRMRSSGTRGPAGWLEPLLPRAPGTPQLQTSGLQDYDGINVLFLKPLSLW